jgi:hypothetical protein
VAGELAAVDVTGLRRYVDDPDDLLILLIAQTLRQDPAGMVKRIDGAFTIFGQLQMIWPQIKDGLGLTTPPVPVPVSGPGLEAVPLAEPLPEPPVESLIS